MTYTLLARIAPQRSTQYAQLASELAPAELYLSPLGPAIIQMEAVDYGGQAYIRLALEAEPTPAIWQELGMLAMSNAFFDFFEQIGDVPGPLLRPRETGFKPFIPLEIAITRRYRGKTNEMFTQFMCNLARYSSDFAHRPWDTLRLCDPLAGGGTTLLIGLALGADVVGVEKTAQDVNTTAAFVRDYAREEGIACKVTSERLSKVAGQRSWLTIGRNPVKQFVYAKGDTSQTDKLISGFKNPHLMVTDLPYGIQHYGAVINLLTEALPVWQNVLDKDGALVFAWDATRMAREEMIALVESVSNLQVLNDAPYDQLAHRVDRVIKARDIIVARHR